MAEGTKELRQATMVLLNKAKEELAKVKDRCVRARAKERQNCKYFVHPDNYHANDYCNAIDSHPECKVVCNSFKRSIEEWIIVSWELEAQLLQNSIDTMEKWIVEDDYDY